MDEARMNPECRLGNIPNRAAPAKPNLTPTVSSFAARSGSSRRRQAANTLRRSKSFAGHARAPLGTARLRCGDAGDRGDFRRARHARAALRLPVKSNPRPLLNSGSCCGILAAASFALVICRARRSAPPKPRRMKNPVPPAPAGTGRGQTVLREITARNVTEKKGTARERRQPN